MLAGRLATKTVGVLAGRGTDAAVRTIELRTLAVEIAKATVGGVPGPELKSAIDLVASSDAVIAAAPVYKAGISGLFKSFVDLLDNDLLIAKPVALIATAGSARHALVPDEQMRALFAFMRALIIPTAVFAAPEDWGDHDLGTRIDRAATELAALIASGATGSIVRGAWNGYQHQFGGNARPQAARAAVGAGVGAGPDGTGPRQHDSGLDDIDLDSDLMRLAAGGTTVSSATSG
jgi:FMN reductase